MKRISTMDAKRGMVLAKAVYSRDGRRLLQPGVELQEDYIARLMEVGIPTIYIQEPDPLAELDKAALYDNVKELPDTISFNTRLEAEKVVHDLMLSGKRGLLFDIGPVRAVVDQIVKEVVDNKNVIGKLADIRILDDYTFAHCVNVCVLSVAMGTILKYPYKKLCDLGVGALLHDLGKIRVPDEILNKPTALSDEEFEVIKNHTSAGYEMLRQHPGISILAANVAYQHHERYNGQGYPRGLQDQQIHEFSKIVAIADAYDALTADRVYKNMVLPYEAVEIIIASSGNHFDPNLVKLFVENTAIYPIGSTVELSDGAVGVITKNHRTLPMRPTVQLLNSKNGEPITGVEVDLMINNTIFVTRVLSFKNMNL